MSEMNFLDEILKMTKEGEKYTLAKFKRDLRKECLAAVKCRAKEGVDKASIFFVMPHIDLAKVYVEKEVSFWLEQGFDASSEYDLLHNVTINISWENVL